MHYSIQFEANNNPFMSISARRKTLKHQLITVITGIALIKIGKNEYVLECGQLFWIPADCLVSITTLPHTHCATVYFSQRLSDSFAKQAGYVSVTPMLDQSFVLLASKNLDAEYRQVLLQVIRYEVVQFAPKLTITQLSQRFMQWSIDQDTGLDAEHNLSLKLREARKKILSGQEKKTVAQDIFKLSTTEFDAFCKVGLGETL